MGSRAMGAKSIFFPSPLACWKADGQMAARLRGLEMDRVWHQALVGGAVKHRSAIAQLAIARKQTLSH